MKDLLKTVETFLTYSEAKLEELSEKNQEHMVNQYPLNYLEKIIDLFISRKVVHMDLNP